MNKYLLNCKNIQNNTCIDIHIERNFLYVISLKLLVYLIIQKLNEMKL